MDEDRFDIRWHEHVPLIDYHFCREMGCYGTNKDHGYELQEAIDEVASWHEGEAKKYRDGSHYKLEYFKGREYDKDQSRTD